MSVQWETRCPTRTDMAKLIAAFSDFACAHKNSREAPLFQLEAPRLVGNFSDTSNVREVGMKNCRLEARFTEIVGKRGAIKSQWLLYVPPELKFTNSIRSLHGRCLIFFPKETAIISLYVINITVFIREKFVY